MRILIKSLVAATLLCSAAVHAEGGYVGGVFGVMNVAIEGDDPLNGGVRAGYTWASGWGIEGEFTGSIVDGNFWYDADYSVSTMAAYGTYRTQGDLYFKGRLGYLNEEVDVESSDIGFSASASDTGLSVGLGGGFRLSENAAVEIEYTLIEEDVDFFSGSVVFRF